MGLYDYLYTYGLTYDNFLKRLRVLSQFLPIKYAELEKQCDELYDSTEYELYKIEQKQLYFENICMRLWDDKNKETETLKNNDLFDDYCNALDDYFDDIHKRYQMNLYVRVLWYVDDKDPQEITDELLDLGKRLKIVQYCSFKDKNDNLIVVALHEAYEPKIEAVAERGGDND